MCPVVKGGIAVSKKLYGSGLRRNDILKINANRKKAFHFRKEDIKITGYLLQINRCLKIKNPQKARQYYLLYFFRNLFLQGHGVWHVYHHGNKNKIRKIGSNSRLDLSTVMGVYGNICKAAFLIVASKNGILLITFR